MRGFLLVEQAHRMARTMVNLEWQARRAAEAGDAVHEAALWRRRDVVRQQRSAILRELVKMRRERRGTPDKAAV